MGNLFELLSLTPRPWIEPETLQSRFLALAAISHPDARPAGGPNAAGLGSSPSPLSPPALPPDGSAVPLDFTELNAAKRTLEDPVRRLKHLLELEAPELIGNLPPLARSPEIQEQFMVVATLLREISAFRSQQNGSMSALQKAVLKAENAQCRRDLEKALSQLDLQWQRCEAQLQALDCVWERRTAEILRELALIHQEMAFLQKWRSELREARLQLDL